MSKQPFICDDCQVMGCEDRCWCCGGEWTRLSWAQMKSPQVHDSAAAVAVLRRGVTVPIEEEADELV